MTGKPQGWVAVILSIVAIGTGQLYAGAWIPAIIFALLALGLGGLGIAALPAGFSGFVLMIALLLVFVVLMVWAAADALRRAKAWPPARPRPAYSRWYVVGAAVLASWSASSTLRSHLLVSSAQAYRIPSTSMAPTLRLGDLLMVRKSPSARVIRRGGVYMYRAVEDQTIEVIKRAVAIGGDTVSMRLGQLFINQRPAAEPYVASAITPDQLPDSLKDKLRRWQLDAFVGQNASEYSPDLDNWGPLAVPLGSFMALGDNRQESYDSRFFGFVPDSLVRGSPAFIYFSRDSLGMIQWARLGMKP